MDEFRKLTWLLPAVVTITVALAIWLAVFAREAIICASFGDWAAVRSYTLGALIPVAGLIFFWWGYAAVRVQQIDDQGVAALTVRFGRITLPWSTVRRARSMAGRLFSKLARHESVSDSRCTATTAPRKRLRGRA